MKQVLEWVGLVAWPLSGVVWVIVAVRMWLALRQTRTVNRRMEADLAESALLRKQMRDMFGEAKPKEPPPS